AETQIHDTGTADSKPRGVLAGYTGTIRAVTFSPDGKTLASVWDGGTIRLWDMTAGKELDGKYYGGTSVAFSPDGKLLFSACNPRLAYAWDLAKTEIIRRFEGHLAEVW